MRVTPDLAWNTISTESLFRVAESPPDPIGAAWDTQTTWGDSPLNPKNRIDSLAPAQSPTWRLDGCTSLGVQFYTIPIYISPLVPMRIDTILPPISQWPPDLRELLEIDTAFLYRDHRILVFGVAQHVLRTLEYWSSNFDFEALYKKLPFGSRIVFTNMEKDIRQIRVQVAPTHDLERQYMSAGSLLGKWGDVPPDSMPPTLDLSQLKFIRQMHDSTSLVKIQTGAKTSQQVVFKTISDSPQYLYHELKLLLTMEPHANIGSRPLHLITKRCRFGGKAGVIGFTMKYEHHGTLRDILPNRRISNTLLLSDQGRWSCQITKALLHITTQAPGFYCDLRLDNILLSDTDDVLLIDFEQRGVLPLFAPPEVNYIQYIDSLSRDSSISSNMKEEYRKLYTIYIEANVPRDTKEFNGCVPWLCLSHSERDAAMVYMLGRVLWCIFEGVSAPEVATWMEYLHEPDLEFPNFCKTPLRLRDIILACTKGWDVMQRKVRRHGKYLFVERGDERCFSEEVVQEEMRREAQQQLEDAERFLEQREIMAEDNPGGYYGRTLIKDVLLALENFENSI
jgi:hypothetical protein